MWLLPMTPSLKNTLCVPQRHQRLKKETTENTMERGEKHPGFAVSSTLQVISSLLHTGI